MKHCVNCKHIVIVLAGNVAMSQCSVRQKNTTADYRNWLVTGGAEPANLVFCTTARGESGHCGPDAKLFEGKMSHSLKQYLGDSVYADYNGFEIILTTENGYGPSNTIVLGQSELAALNRYIEWARNEAEEIRKQLEKASGETN